MNAVEIVRAEFSRLKVPAWQRDEVESAGFEAAAKALTRDDLRNPGAFIRVTARRAMQKEQRRLIHLSRMEQPVLSVTLYGEYTWPKEMMRQSSSSRYEDPYCILHDEQLDRAWRAL